MDLILVAPIGFVGGGGPVSASFTDHKVDSVDRNTYTFTAASLGTADAARRIAVGVAASAGSAPTVQTLTIGGVSAAKDIRATNGDSTIEIWSAIVPSGTTGDVVVDFGGGSGVTRCGIGVFSLVNAGAASSTTSSTADPGSASLTIPTGGAGIGISSNRKSQTNTWSNMTEQYDEDIEAGGLSHTGAFTSTAGSPTVTCSYSSALQPLMVLAAYPQA